MRPVEDECACGRVSAGSGERNADGWMLADVLAEHMRLPLQCWCGWQVPKRTDGRRQWAAHVAEVLEEWCTASEPSDSEWCACGKLDGRVHPYRPDAPIHEGPPCPPTIVPTPITAAGGR